ncbi:MAG: PIN domain-containing protein [Planctomycetes bacterium]|nr:PIN domain-containing protein [Planctomycetota bacterium]
MLDTSILIAAEKMELDLAKLLSSEAASTPVFISAVTASEILHGCDRAPAGTRRDLRKRFVEDILELMPTVPFGLDEARTHARLWAQLEKEGQRIGAHDLLIAAACVHLKFRLATLNGREFARVPGLELIDPGPYLTDKKAGQTSEAR